MSESSGSSSAEEARALLARIGVRSTLTDEQLREILSSSDSGNTHSPPRSFSGSGSGLGDSGASRGSGVGDGDDALSLPSEMLAELASPRPGHAPRAWAVGPAAPAPGYELLVECVVGAPGGPTPSPPPPLPLLPLHLLPPPPPSLPP